MFLNSILTLIYFSGRVLWRYRRAEWNPKFWLYVGIFQNVIRMLFGIYLQLVRMLRSSMHSGVVGLSIRFCGFQKRLVLCALFKGHGDFLFGVCQNFQKLHKMLHLSAMSIFGTLFYCVSNGRRERCRRRWPILPSPSGPRQKNQNYTNPFS